jgi:hypothetical protein
VVEPGRKIRRKAAERHFGYRVSEIIPILLDPFNRAYVIVIYGAHFLEPFERGINAAPIF